MLGLYEEIIGHGFLIGEPKRDARKIVNTTLQP
jgi:hypothetical protein